MTANLYIGGAFQSDDGIIGGNLKISKERASNEMYYRTKVSGSITFLKKDYQALYEMDLDTRCEVQLIEGGLIASATFFKTDCEFDVDNGICTLKPKFVDNYEKLIQGIDNKENITRLGAPTNLVEGRIRPVLQLYLEGESKVTNLVGNMSYEVDADAPNDISEVTAKGFNALDIEIGLIDFESDSSSMADVVGNYMGRVMQVGERPARYHGLLYNRNGYYIDYTRIVGTGVTMVWHKPNGDVFNPEGTPSEYYNRRIFTRIIGNTKVDDTWIELVDDFVETSTNYRYAKAYDSIAGYRFNTLFYISQDTQDEPTEWGRAYGQKYFIKPTTESEEERYFPVFRSQWIPLSWWFKSSVGLAGVVDQCNQTAFFCKDAFSIADVIRKLINKVDDRILGVQSEFLEPTLDHPMFPTIFSIFTRWWITPITNIKKTYYEQAAQRGDISIQDILKMLRALGLYWHLENTRYGYVMRIEHYLWYRNGGSYGSDTRTPIISLGNVSSPKLGKPWSFGQNKVSWELDKPKRLEFAWQSECTEEFNGYPLEIKNAYMEKGSKDTISAGVFVSDIDLVIASPSEVGDDCFALFMTNRVANVNVIPLVDANIPGATPLVRMQNGYLSYLWIEQNLLKYGLGGNRYSIEDAEFTENKTARMRKQDVVFPIGWDSLQEYGLIETPMGKGEIVKVEWDVESHKASATIKLDNE